MYIIIICIVFQCFCSVFLMNKRVCHYYYSGRRVARVLLFNSTGDRKPQLLLSSLWVHNSLSVLSILQGFPTDLASPGILFVVRENGMYYSVRLCNFSCCARSVMNYLVLLGLNFIIYFVAFLN